MVEKFKSFWKKSLWSKLLVVVIVLAIVGMCMPSDEEDTTAKKESQTVEKKETKTESNTEVKKEVKKDDKKYVGNVVKNGDYEVTIQKPQISKTFGIQGAEDTAKGQYVTFQVTVANKGKDSGEVSGDDFNLYVKGAKHSPASVVSEDEQVKPLVFEELSPNTSVTSTITYDVAEPVDLKGAYIEFELSNEWDAKPVKIYIE